VAETIHQVAETKTIGRGYQVVVVEEVGSRMNQDRLQHQMARKPIQVAEEALALVHHQYSQSAADWSCSDHSLRSCCYLRRLHQSE